MHRRTGAYRAIVSVAEFVRKAVLAAPAIRSVAFGGCESKCDGGLSINIGFLAGFFTANFSEIGGKTEPRMTTRGT